MISDFLAVYGWILIVGFLVCSGCGYLGHFLIVRRMALTGDALSHSLLPGIVGIFLLFKTRSSLAMGIGALFAGLLTTFALNLLQGTSRLKADAVLTVVFSTAFALGVLGISLFADSVDLDLDCVLFGDLAYIPLGEHLTVFNFAVPDTALRVIFVWLICLGTLKFFYKEFLLMSFDAVFAQLTRLPVQKFHYLFMGLLSLMVVVSFEAVGVVLVVGMLIFPSASMQILSKNAKTIYTGIACLSSLYTIGGTTLAIALDLPIGPAMMVVATFVLTGAIIFQRVTHTFRLVKSNLNDSI